MKHISAVFIILAILLAALPGAAQKTYTSPAAFNAALAGFVSDELVHFDSQPSGTPAVEYGPMSISARGLASDGEQLMALSPIATAAYPTVSGANSLGVNFDHTSFLSGNSDSIDFRFSAPIHAFGVYLIGNPSPTGDPAIPFWRMRLYVSGGYHAYSDTEPLFTMINGDGVYFLGAVSPTLSFTRAVIYSDNDPDAVFSFTVDDLVYAAAPGVVTIVQAKSEGVESLTLSNVVVTRTHSDRFNVQQPGTPFGISVLGQGAVRGQAVTLIGVATTTGDGERVIDLRQIANATESTPANPIGLRTKAVGGSTPVGLQPGTLGAYGPNNIGVDARISGKVSGMGPAWIVVDDGSGRSSGVYGTSGEIPGVKVAGMFSYEGLEIGSPVTVTGSVSMFACTTGYYPLIRVAQPGDLVLH